MPLAAVQGELQKFSQQNEHRLRGIAPLTSLLATAEISHLRQIQEPWLHSRPGGELKTG